jgi:hypothetical protein
LMMLKAGTGITTCSTPAKSAMWRYKGTPEILNEINYR